MLTEKGRLVMGAGIAKQARDMYPGLDHKLGVWVELYGNRPFRCIAEKIISFPTKNDWRRPSDLSLIIKSAQLIVEIANKFKITSIATTRPGCGNGGLVWEDVKPELEKVLDDRFTVVSLD